MDNRHPRLIPVGKFLLYHPYIWLPPKSTETDKESERQKERKLKRLLEDMKAWKVWMGVELFLTLTDIIQRH